MGQGHAGKGKPSKLAFVSDEHMLVTTGFSSTGQRQFALWDSVSQYPIEVLYPLNS